MSTSGPQSPTPEAIVGESDSEGAVPAQAGIMTEYSGLHEPLDGVYEHVARMTALIFAAPIVTVAIANDPRVWFPVSEGPEDGGVLPAERSLSSLLDVGSSAQALADASADVRTANHPWVKVRDGVRFLAVAPILIGSGRVVGTVEVMDRKRRRHTSDVQLSLLSGMAATIAQLFDLRIGALTTLRGQSDDHAAEITRRDHADQLAAQMSQAATRAHDRERPYWCQLGGPQACDQSAELKVTDSWGDSAWGCWQHAEDALIQVPSVFLATESPNGLAAYRKRIARPLPATDA